MSTHIVKIKGLYADWSTIVNAPVSNFMIREDFIDWHKDQRTGQLSQRIIDEMALADETGVGCTSVSLDELIANNCAGIDRHGDERALTADELLEQYSNKGEY
jgi:hypothetical protein